MRVEDDEQGTGVQAVPAGGELYFACINWPGLYAAQRTEVKHCKRESEAWLRARLWATASRYHRRGAL